MIKFLVGMFEIYIMFKLIGFGIRRMLHIGRKNKRKSLMTEFRNDFTRWLWQKQRKIHRKIEAKETKQVQKYVPKKKEYLMRFGGES